MQNAETLESLKNDASRRDSASTSRRVADAIHTAVDDTATKAEELEKQLRERASTVSEKVGASQEAATAQVKESLSTVETFARERPIVAAGIAFAAGVLATTLVRR